MQEYVSVHLQVKARKINHGAGLLVHIINKETQMPKYLVQANSTVEGGKGLLKEGGTSRRAAVEKLVKSLGGTVDSFYYAFGEIDEYVIIDLPDNVSMAAASLTVSASGAAMVKTTVLVTPEEIDEAVRKSPSYRPPGQ
jgi:uncharacterized protein with GYD domain